MTIGKMHGGWYRKCAECGLPFYAVREDARRCGNTCRQRARRRRQREHEQRRGSVPLFAESSS